MPTRDVVTVYSRIGDSFAYLSVAALILLADWALARKAPAAHMPGSCASGLLCWQAAFPYPLFLRPADTPLIVS